MSDQPPSQPPYQPPQGGWQQQTPANPYAGAAGQNPFDSETTVILVCGILSLVVCGLIGIAAWMQGNSLKKRAEEAGWPEPSMGKVGRILGIVGTCLGALQLVMGLFWLGFVVFAIGSAPT